MTDPLRVLITGAAGQMAYSLIYSVAKGDVFGCSQPVILHLLDIEAMMGALGGVVLEMTDCALPSLKAHFHPCSPADRGKIELVCRIKQLPGRVVPTADIPTAFRDIDVAILVGAMPRREGMERKDLLKANVEIFKQQGEALDQYAKKTVKVLVVGNPANTNAYICKRYAPSIPPQNFTCLTRLDQNRAQAQIALRIATGVSGQDVHNVIVWGNHSNTQFPDVTYATVTINGHEVKVSDAVKDDHWLRNDFILIVQKRGADVITTRKLSSAISASKAACDHMHDWWFGTKPKRWTSMGVTSDGSYGIPPGLIYSFPVQTYADHSYTIVQGLAVDEFARDRMNATLAELQEERELAESVCIE